MDVSQSQSTKHRWETTLLGFNVAGHQRRYCLFIAGHLALELIVLGILTLVTSVICKWMSRARVQSISTKHRWATAVLGFKVAGHQRRYRLFLRWVSTSLLRVIISRHVSTAQRMGHQHRWKQNGDKYVLLSNAASSPQTRAATRMVLLQLSLISMRG